MIFDVWRDSYRGKRVQNKLRDLCRARNFVFGDFFVSNFFLAMFANYVAGALSSEEKLQYWLTFIDGECFRTTFP